MEELCYMCRRKLYSPQEIRLVCKDRFGKHETIEYRVCEMCMQKVSSYIENYWKQSMRFALVPAEDPEDPF